MRRAIWRGLAVFSGYLVALDVHHLAARWNWYTLRPGVTGDDPLAVVVWIVVTAIIWKGLNELYRA